MRKSLEDLDAIGTNLGGAGGAAAIVEVAEPDTIAKAKPDYEALPLSEQPNRIWSLGLDWPILIWLGFVHVGALAAPFFFTWKALALFCFLYWVTGSLGVCLGYHRLLTHSSFHTFRWVRRFFGLIGTLAGEGPPITWVAVHRKHHRYSDQDLDPHSPHHGGWWSHVLWLFPQPREPQWQSMINRYSVDLLKDPFMRMLDKTFLLWHIGLGALIFSVGWAVWDLHTGVSLLVWGMFVRMVVVLHATWAVNSASHIWGYRNYETRDDSRNLWWVGLVAFGEGWHNNHHAFPGRARHGHRWWEIDMTFGAIWLMEKVGLVWKVNRGRKNEAIDAEE